jgi:hypothetical protein
LKDKLDCSLWFQDHKLLKVREGASFDEINMTTHHMVLYLHPDRNHFNTWVQEQYTHLAELDMEHLIIQGKKVLLEYWHKWQQAKQNMIAQDQGICKQAPYFIHTCIYNCTCSHVYI